MADSVQMGRFKGGKTWQQPYLDNQTWGTAQYIAVGGSDAADLLRALLAQQRADGAMPGAPDDFSGGGVWTTRSAGVAPTAWLYHALQPSLFTPVTWSRCCAIRLPLIVR